MRIENGQKVVLQNVNTDRAKMGMPPIAEDVDGKEVVFMGYERPHGDVRTCRVSGLQVRRIIDGRTESRPCDIVELILLETSLKPV